MRRSLLVLVLVALACRRTAATAEKAPVRTRARTMSEDSLRTVPLWNAKPGHEPAFLEFQVEKTVLGVPGGPFPTYPPALQKAHVEGRVLIQFVVDTAGHAEEGTYTVLESTDPAFSQAVLDVLPRRRFFPATVRGKKVRQVVQEPFFFAIGR